MSSNVAQIKTDVPNPNDPNDPAWEPVREKINKLIEGGGIKATQIAKESACGATALNQFLNRKYTGRNDLIRDRLERWFETYKRRLEAEQEMTDGPGFVMTPTAQKITDTVSYAHMAHDIVLVYGGAGTGKTETFREYVRNNSGVCLATMTPAHATVATSLREIGKCVGVHTTRDNAMLFDNLTEALKDRRGILIIDEAQNLGIKALDQIRQIHDKINCGIVLSGNEQVYSNMSGRRAEYLDRLHSRIGMRTHINRPSAQDAERIADAWGITDATSIATIVSISLKPGGLRLVSKVLRLAHMYSQKGQIQIKQIRIAWKQLGGLEA